MAAKSLAHPLHSLGGPGSSLLLHCDNPCIRLCPILFKPSQFIALDPLVMSPDLVIGCVFDFP